MFQILFILVYRMRSFGSHHVPSEGPVVLMANHQSHFDPPVIGICATRQCFYMARDTLFKFKPFSRLIRSLGAIPINRENNPLPGIKATLKCLKRGGIVLLFPEGTRTRNGKIGPLQPGFITLIRRAKATIVPVAIDGAYLAWPRQKKFPGRADIHIRFGAPILPEQAAKLDEAALIGEVDRRIHACLEEVRKHPVFFRKTGHPTIALRLTKGVYLLDSYLLS